MVDAAGLINKFQEKKTARTRGDSGHRNLDSAIRLLHTTDYSSKIQHGKDYKLKRCEGYSRPSNSRHLKGGRTTLVYYWNKEKGKKDKGG